MRRVIIARAAADKIAPKYCFKATSHMKTKNGRLLASFTAYEKTPEVAASVQRACEAMRAAQDSDALCCAVELIMYEKCPTECDGEISTVTH